ncbi:hypothetical protein [Enterobacter asburiae]|jgi:deoxyinosine 3'endonuclease (endonuclease V)|uniref:hypothetical protein n=1 Tax=Enterobacter asburiae TaxID=61645 RepID=UPI00192C158C|nr:hypothetical protein [Enterobacter asburiae]MBL5911207.1 hypothetical protein [Enterobacter asburiae]
MSDLTGLASFLQTDMGKMMVGIAKDYLIPYGKERLFAAMKPVEMSEEEIKQRAQDEFVTVDDFDIKPPK